MLTRRYLLASVPATLAFAPVAGASTPAAISEDGFVPVGGIEQWVAIRGRDRSRPPILFLHGGPGEAQSLLLSLFAPWEERYVVAQWDQRGSGKTFEKNGPSTPDMTLEKMAQDTIEVTQNVLRRLGLRKLVLVGHSWGSILGLTAARLRPELFHAFVGTGQVINGRELVDDWRTSALARAQAAGDNQAVAAIKGLGPDDLADFNKLGTVFKWMEPFIASDWNYLGTRISNPASDEANKWSSGSFFSLSNLWKFAVGFDARAAGTDLPLPFFVIDGRNDNRVPPVVAHAFVDQVRAPAKNYTEIEGGHFACFTNPTGFLNALDADLRSLEQQ